MGELVITSGGLVLSVGAIGEALSMMLVVLATGASAALVLHVLLKDSENRVQIDIDSQDILSTLV